VTSKLRTVSRISEVGVVAVVRADNGDLAVEIAEDCLAGGITAIEITFRFREQKS
jgi:2-dehydro-3-deoxyphosphogluconate aldolase/(4S)-4-hydroxy-2-oxoglutarate aldolase